MINTISPSGIVNKSAFSVEKSVKPLAPFSLVHLCECIVWHLSSFQFFPKFAGLDNYTPLKSVFSYQLCVCAVPKLKSLLFWLGDNILFSKNDVYELERRDNLVLSPQALQNLGRRFKGWSQGLCRSAQCSEMLLCPYLHFQRADLQIAALWNLPVHTAHRWSCCYLPNTLSYK